MPTILVSAGEASGDLYASLVVEELRRILPDTAFFGCTGPGWVYSQAVKHGAYAGSAAEARTQHPTLWQRVQLVQVKHRIKRGMR